MLQNRGFINFEMAQEAVRRAIEHYNTLRSHGSCNYHTPEQAHQMEDELAQSGVNLNFEILKKYNPKVLHESLKIDPKFVKLFQGYTGFITTLMLCELG